VSLDEPVPIAKRIAEALDAAYGKGSFIAISNREHQLRTRHVKVSEFGLAKAHGPGGRVERERDVPT